MVPWAHPSPHPKRHVDRFSGFCRAHDRDRPTDRQTTLLRLWQQAASTYALLRCGLIKPKSTHWDGKPENCDETICRPLVVMVQHGLLNITNTEFRVHQQWFHGPEVTAIKGQTRAQQLLEYPTTDSRITWRLSPRGEATLSVRGRLV